MLTAEKSFSFIRDTAFLIDAWNKEHPETFISMHVDARGFTLKALYSKEGDNFVQENLTPWQSLTAVGLKESPMTSAFEALLKAVQLDQARA